jgi:hypothetical protein
VKASETFRVLAAYTDPQKVSEACEEPSEIRFAVQANGFHEKVSLVKVNVVTEAQTKARRVRLLPRFHSHSV